MGAEDRTRISWQKAAIWKGCWAKLESTDSVLKALGGPRAVSNNKVRTVARAISPGISGRGSNQGWEEQFVVVAEIATSDGV